MIPPAPEIIKKSLGEETTEAFGRWIQEILQSNTVSRNEFGQITQRLDKLESRLEDFRKEVSERFDLMQQNFNQRFDAIQQNFNQRFDAIQQNFDQRFDAIQQSFNDRFDRMNERFDSMYERVTTLIKWTVGTLALFGTLITILLTISQFVK